MELLKQLFEGAGLPADFESKASTLFEAAVNEAAEAKAAEQVKTLQEAFDQKLEEAINEKTEAHMANLTKFLDQTILEWAKENAIGIDGKLKVELAEQFLGGLKGLFEQADVVINGDQEGAVKSLQMTVEQLQAEKQALESQLVEAQANIIAGEKAAIVAEATEDLADTQADRIAKLCEGFEFKSIEDYKEKVTLVVEAVTGKKAKTEDAKDGDPEDKDPDQDGDDDDDGSDTDNDEDKDKDKVDEKAKGKKAVKEKFVKVDDEKTKAATAGNYATHESTEEHVEEVNTIVEQTKKEHAPHYGEDLAEVTLKYLRGEIKTV